MSGMNIHLTVNTLPFNNYCIFNLLCMIVACLPTYIVHIFCHLLPCTLTLPHIKYFCLVIWRYVNSENSSIKIALTGTFMSFTFFMLRVHHNVDKYLWALRTLLTNWQPWNVRLHHYWMLRPPLRDFFWKLVFPVVFFLFFLFIIAG